MPGPQEACAPKLARPFLVVVYDASELERLN